MWTVFCRNATHGRVEGSGVSCLCVLAWKVEVDVSSSRRIRVADPLPLANSAGT